MMDLGIYEIKKDENTGSYEVTEQLSGETTGFSDLDHAYAIGNQYPPPFSHRSAHCALKVSLVLALYFIHNALFIFGSQSISK